MEEIWKPVLLEGFEGKYEVSNHGRLKSKRFKKVVTSTRFSKKGYPVFRLTDSNHHTRSFFAHRIIAQAFIPNPNNYPQVNHIDCVKTNNHTSNLEWCTNKMNWDHAVKSGVVRWLKGEESPHAKLTERQVLRIRDLFDQGYSRRQLSEKFKIKMHHVKDIISRRSWKHL